MNFPFKSRGNRLNSPIGILDSGHTHTLSLPCRYIYFFNNQINRCYRASVSTIRRDKQFDILNNRIRPWGWKKKKPKNGFDRLSTTSFWQTFDRTRPYAETERKFDRCWFYRKQYPIMFYRIYFTANITNRYAKGFIYYRCVSIFRAL